MYFPSIVYMCKVKFKREIKKIYLYRNLVGKRKRIKRKREKVKVKGGKFKNNSFFALCNETRTYFAILL